MAFGEQDILAAYADGDEVLYNGVETVGLFSRAAQRPVTTEVGVMLVSEDTLRFVVSELPGIARETVITIDGTDYRIREIRPLNRLESEAVVVLEG